MNAIHQGPQHLLRHLRDTLAQEGDGQARLDTITALIAQNMQVEVCSIYLMRDKETLELCATTGLRADAVHQTRMRIGEGLVGRVARLAKIINTDNAQRQRGFRFMPETGEEIFNSMLAVPIQRLGEVLGVLVVQTKEHRRYADAEEAALEVVAMVLAEMRELGAFTGEGQAMSQPHQHALLIEGLSAQEGTAEGVVWRHDPEITVSHLVTDNPEEEKRRLHQALGELRDSVDDMLAAPAIRQNKEQRDILEAYRMFSNSRSWIARIEAGIDQGLSAEVAVEKEQSATRAQMSRIADPYLRERLHDLDDLSNRLLRTLTGAALKARDLPENAVLVARNIGPAELLDYGKVLKGVVLEEGSVGAHAAIIARAWAIPMVIHAKRITTEALTGDSIILDGDQGLVHLRPDEVVAAALRDKMAMQRQANERYAAIRGEPAVTRDGKHIALMMNAGLMADLPSFESSGAEGVGLFRTELQFLASNSLPSRKELAQIYARVIEAAQGHPVTFRTLDIGSDKVLPYLKRIEEPNPAMGWRALRLALEKTGIMRMQLQAFLRAAQGRPLRIMFPFVAQFEEFQAAREAVFAELHRESSLGHVVPDRIEIGAMLETPSLAFAPDAFFKLTDFISIGGNDLKQFFFAADRENERVRRRYDTLNFSYLSFIELIADRCRSHDTPLSFCGEDAGKPLEALALAAMGLRSLSMRPASIGPVKEMLRRHSLVEVRQVIEEARRAGGQSVRAALRDYIELKTPR